MDEFQLGKGIRVRYLITAVLVSLFIASSLSAETPEERGLSIALEMEKRDKGWGDSTSELEMVLKNRHGETSVRQMRGQSLEVEGDGDKSLMVFDNPRDVKGTAMLTWSHKEGDDDQWLYLPALKRVKRISSSSKSGSFMGSEFSYEDLSSREVNKYTYKFLREESCPCEELKALSCFVSESFPVDKSSGYTKLISWADTDEYRSCRVEFYDRKSSHLKTLIFGDYKKFLDKFWRPMRLDVTNHQSGKSTSMVFKEYKFKTGLKDPDFNQNALMRFK